MADVKMYGYVRVSTAMQHEDRQVYAMHEFGVPECSIVVEKVSGKDFRRPKYQKLLDQLREGDVLVVKSIDRLGRNYRDILEHWWHITKEVKASIVVIDMPLLDTRKRGNDLTGAFVADLVLQILSYVAETERQFMRQRVNEGISAAKKRGVRFGRPKIMMPEDFADLISRWEHKEIDMSEILELVGINRATFYRRVKELKEAQMKENQEEDQEEDQEENQIEELEVEEVQMGEAPMEEIPIEEIQMEGFQVENFQVGEVRAEEV